MTAYGSSSSIHNMCNCIRKGTAGMMQYSDAIRYTCRHSSGNNVRRTAMAVLAAAMLLIMTAGIITYDEAWAQQNLQGAAASQESITITIGTGTDGLDMHVRHVLNPSDTKTILRLVDSGTISGSIDILPAAAGTADTNAVISGTLIPEMNGTVVVIPPLDADAAVEYTVSGAVNVLAGGIHVVQYAYPHTTLVIIPDDTEMIFVNGRLIELDGKQKIACHGCSMTLEYAAKIVPDNDDGSGVSIYSVQMNGYMEIPVHVTSRPDIRELKFDLMAGNIVIQSGSGDLQFVSVSIPVQLMTGPFDVSLDGQKIHYHDSANTTHSTITMRLESGGAITIGGVLAGHILEYRQQYAERAAQPDTADSGNNKDSEWMTIVVIAGAGGAAAIMAATYKYRISRRGSRTSKTHTRQFGSHSQGIFHHTLPPTPLFQTT